MTRRAPSLRQWLPFVFLLACLVFVGYALPDRLLLFPSREVVPTQNSAAMPLPFRGGELQIWTAKTRVRYPGSGAKPDVYVLHFYGNAERADDNVGVEIKDWAARDTELWGVNYPGYGGSTGTAHLSSLAPAGLAAYDAMRAQAGLDRPIIVQGTSIGSTVALYVAAQRKDVAGLILQNPPPIRRIILGKYGWWNLWLIAGPVALGVPGDLDSLGNARQAHAKAVFLLASEDEVVPPKYQRLVFDAYAGEKRAIALAGAHHNSPVEGNAVTQLSKDVTWMLGEPARTR